MDSHRRRLHGIDIHITRRVPTRPPRRSCARSFPPEGRRPKAAYLGQVTENSATLARLSTLVEDALDRAEDPAFPASVLTSRALRIARLRNDWLAIMTLQAELRTSGDKDAKQRVVVEVSPHLTEAELDAAWDYVLEAYIARRSMGEGVIIGESVAELEISATGLQQQADGLQAEILANPGLGDRLGETRADLSNAATSRLRVLTRVRQRVIDYLSEVERHLVFGEINADAFERNRHYVDERLAQIAPAALEQFAAAHRRVADGDVEARSQALASCRRVLKSVADAVCPATGETVVGTDGRERVLSDDKYLVRLLHYAQQQIERSASGDLLTARLRQIGERLAPLNDLASKGVHATVTADEVDQCLIHTYLLVGDLLRLADE